MSIRVNQRHVSQMEYEHTFGKLNQYISDKLRRLPIRRHRFLVAGFNRCLNDIYKNIADITTLYELGKAKSIDRYRLCIDTLQKIDSVIMYSYYYWNIACDKNGIKFVTFRKRKFWAELINQEVALIIGVAKKCRGFQGEIKVEDHRIIAFSKSDFENAIFLQKLCELQRIVYGRAMKTCKAYQDARLELLIDLTREAFYYAKTANDASGTTEEGKMKRDRCFGKAINSVMAMNRPIAELAFSHLFSEVELEEICCLLTDVQKILCTIRKNESNKQS